MNGLNGFLWSAAAASFIPFTHSAFRVVDYGLIAGQPHIHSISFIDSLNCLVLFILYCWFFLLSFDWWRQRWWNEVNCWINGMKFICGRGASLIIHSKTRKRKQLNSNQKVAALRLAPFDGVSDGAAEKEERMSERANPARLFLRFIWFSFHSLLHFFQQFIQSKSKWKLNGLEERIENIL